MKPLENMIVLDFSQYLAGPSAALRLADMGARVIKIERPGSGDGSRQMKLHNLDRLSGHPKTRKSQKLRLILHRATCQISKWQKYMEYRQEQF